MTDKKIVQFVFSMIIFIGGFSFNVNYASSFTEPTVVPPGGNIAGPITTGSGAQWRAGSLGIGTGGAASGALLLDVEGDVGAVRYCDQDGNNCFAITALGGGSGVTEIDGLADGRTDGASGSSVFLGYGAGANDDLTDNKNVFLGVNAGNSSTSGENNVGVGFESLKDNSTGEGNSSFGAHSLDENTSGKYNSAFGTNSLDSSTTANFNSAFGSHSMCDNTTGEYNSAFGTNSLDSITTANYNSAFGAQSMIDNTTG